MIEALDIFPTEIWEMIVYFVFESDCMEDSFDAMNVCKGIEMPIEPMIKRMMNQLLPIIKRKAISKLTFDFNDDSIYPFKAPQYIHFYSQLGRFCKGYSIQLPKGFIDSILTEFISTLKKSSWQELHFAHRRLEIVEHSLDFDSDNFQLIQEWIQFIYMFLFSNIFPCKSFLKMNFHAHQSLKKQLGARFFRRYHMDEETDEETEDLWRSEYLL